MSNMPNHLASSLSPYLLQHQYNPVDWYPWGKEALEKATHEDKPIFLSIGYSACHWCHVMEKESFEDKEVAELLNKHFINIKVDREERPDLDRLYMSCVQAMTGHGGWPMSIFMTPNLKPFLAGTYFPPTSRYGMPGFRSLLQEIILQWKHNRTKLTGSSEKVFQYLWEEESQHQQFHGSLSNKLLERLVEDCQKDYDSEWGGFGKAPKFPQAGAFFALLHQYHHHDQPENLKMITHTLEQMARGGIYDQLGGGFHRYSVDEKWLIPHFEKMLYDNALLSRLYLEAYQLTRQKSFLDVALHTLQYLLREMRDPLGGFYSAEDADSEGEEGKFYLWSLAQIEESLQDPQLFCHTYGITKEGNFEGKNILHLLSPLEALSFQEQEKLAVDRQILLEKRNKRIRPGLDDKILVDWNALLISSLAKAYQITGESLYLESAQQAAQFIENNMIHEGQLYHLWRRTLGSTPGFLEDYANYILALLDLYEYDFNINWLERAQNMMEKMRVLFWDPKDKAFFASSLAHGSLLVRKKVFNDDATPAGNAHAALAFLRLGSYYERREYNQMAEQILSLHATAMQQAPKWYGTLLCAVDCYLSSMQQIVLLGDVQDKKIQNLLAVIYSEYLPHKVVSLVNKSSQELPVNKGKEGDPGTAFVCYQQRCFPPTSDPSKLHCLLKEGAAL
ncbi:thioredoxin domain-containing protein [Neochlamydia sp. AcF65]|uniref:thioredoxin domain-containing protein n=1 Tax=Neochlamydia sp. AcF65 TaxID=2795735 RepID=UPI001BC9092B|nr:thioredoxin domain-containing protein [Neochlamydia sp. AcF65]